MEKAANTIKLFIGERNLEGFLQISNKDLSELDSESIDHIRSEFNLQCFPKEKLVSQLKEYKRILKKGKTIIISVPDFFLIAGKYSNSKMRIEDINRSLSSSVFFFDFVSFQKILISCGFYAVKRLNVENINTDEKFFFDGENISLTIEAYA